jgi:molybdopterin synthase catalytic subunit
MAFETLKNRFEMLKSKLPFFKEKYQKEIQSTLEAGQWGDIDMDNYKFLAEKKEDKEEIKKIL